jgi:hypothetical protein
MERKRHRGKREKRTTQEEGGRENENERERERERGGGREGGRMGTAAGETKKGEYWTFSTEWSLKKRQSHIRDAHLPR